jgi:hypothetical protein
MRPASEALCLNSFKAAALQDRMVKEGSGETLAGVL